jgi:uncharacterized protein (DUF2236 family)
MSGTPPVWPDYVDRPREDYGIFGPDSPSWKVWTHPTAVLGFQRAVTLETLDPHLTAAVWDTNEVRTNTIKRIQRTFDYFVTVAVADSRTVVEMSELLLRVHSYATGIDPISGRRYNANNPESQLWIHVTGWHSVLLCYERYGPGLTPDEERRFWQECVTAAEFQTCDPADVPGSREEVREYYAAVRPKLCVSERQKELASYFLYTPRATSSPVVWGVARAIAPAVLATLPRWMRDLMGFRQSWLTGVLARPVTRFGMWFFEPTEDRLAALELVSPATGKIIAPALRGVPPREEVTRTPAEARARYGTVNRRESVAS